MRLLHCGAILFAGLVAFATALIAQGPDTLSPAQRAGRALVRLGAGQRVRIITRENAFVDGSVVTTSPRLVSVRTDGSVIDIPVPSVDFALGRARHARGKGSADRRRSRPCISRCRARNLWRPQRRSP
jgi:hypothetical protein